MDFIGLTLGMGPPAGGGQSQQSPAFMFVWLFIMMAVFYVLLIRPQKKKEKERRMMIANIKTGDRIAFSGGILGAVTNVKDKTLTIKIADNVKIEVSRGAVSQVLDKGEHPDADS